MHEHSRVLLRVILVGVLAVQGCGKKENITIPSGPGTNIISKTDLEKSISKSIDFLYQAQLDYGEFKTYACSNIKMTDCYFDSSPYVTATVLYSLKEIDTEKARVITEKGLNFLLSEKEAGGIWRFWTSRNRKKIKPDLDDIALISYVLKLNNIEFEDNLAAIENNRNSEGLFLTWINEDENDNKNDVDCAVNATVLLYLGKCYPEVCQYLNDVIRNRNACSIYYPDDFFLYYYIARAVENGVDCFSTSKEIIVSAILKDQEKYGISKSNLHNALSVNTLIILGYRGQEVTEAIGSLLANQKKKGSWKIENAALGPAPYYGSEELSTAFALEALNRQVL